MRRVQEERGAARVPGRPSTSRRAPRAAGRSGPDLPRGGCGFSSSGMLVRPFAAALAAVLVVAAAALAQPLGPATVPHPIRLEGYWERTRAEPDVIGEVSIAAEGRGTRRFGVTAVQAYQPEEEGMQIFRFTSDRPATLVARGDGVGRLFAAPRDRKVVVFATYASGSGLFVVGSVDVAAGAPAPRR